jgi:hypothetical protein
MTLRSQGGLIDAPTFLCLAISRQRSTRDGIIEHLTGATAANQTFRTVLGAGGIEAALDIPGGGRADFTSRVVVTPDGTFDENGTITYGDLGTVEFKTLGRGYLLPSGIEGLQRGGVLWEVTRGTGQFAGASGVITSNFSVAADGTVVDNHMAVLYLPE